MKRFLTTLSLIVMAMSLNAQIAIMGTVTDFGGAAIANHTVYIASDSSVNPSFPYFATLTTDAAGFYIDTINAPSGAASDFIVTTYDCQRQGHSNLVQLSAGGVLTGVPSNFSICAPITPPACTAVYWSNPDSMNTLLIHFSNLSTSATTPVTYAWTFGDGSTSTATNPSHTYAAAGNYTVCLTITAGACTDTYCSNVTVIAGGGRCAAFYNYSNGTGSTVNFTDASSPGAGTVTYSWDFGDGNTSTVQNPTHTYGSAGVYNACLTINVANGGGVCTNTYCGAVTAGTIPVSHAIGGSVFTGSTLADDGIAYLIQYDASTQILSLVDSQSLDSSGMFYFGGLSAGDYTVKAALTPISAVYANYLPTYLGDVLFWSGASFVMLTQAQPNSFQNRILMVAGTNPGGPGFVGGSVLTGANKDAGDPVANAQVMLLDASMNPVAYTYSDATGNFNFTNLAYGTYYIYTEVMNKPTTPLMVVVSASMPAGFQAIIEVNSTIVTGFSTATAIDPAVFVNKPSLFPNPTSGAVRMAINLKVAASARLSVYNTLGAEVMVKNLDLTAGNSEVNLDMSELSTGLYTLSLQVADAAPVGYRVVKK